MSEPTTSWHDAPGTEDPQHAEYLQHAEDPQHSEAQENEEQDEDSDVISCMSLPVAHHFVDNPQPSESPCCDYLESINLERDKMARSYRNLLLNPKKNIISLRKLYQTPLLHKIILWEDGKWQGVDTTLGPAILAEYRSNCPGGWSKMSPEYTEFVKVLRMVPNSTMALILGK